MIMQHINILLKALQEGEIMTIGSIVANCESVLIVLRVKDFI